MFRLMQLQRLHDLLPPRERPGSTPRPEPGKHNSLPCRESFEVPASPSATHRVPRPESHPLRIALEDSATTVPPTSPSPSCHCRSPPPNKPSRLHSPPATRHPTRVLPSRCSHNRASDREFLAAPSARLFSCGLDVSNNRR